MRSNCRTICSTFSRPKGLKRVRWIGRRVGAINLMNETITLYYREGSSDKVYEVKLVQHPHDTGFHVDFRYGRRGSSMQHGIKTTASLPYAQAKKIYDKLVQEKRAKGYVVGPESRSQDFGTVSTNTVRAQPIAPADLSRLLTGNVTSSSDSGLRLQLLNDVDESRVQGLINSNLWGMQVKMDGRRQAIIKKGSDVQGVNRKGLFIPLADAISDAAHDILGNGTIDGEAMGNVFHAFDLLADGPDIRSLTYAERYRRLSIVLGKKKGAIRLLPMAVTTKDKQAMFDMAKRTNCEGVVFKRLDMGSNPGRPNSGGVALKFKFYATASVVVEIHTLNKRSVRMSVFQGNGHHVLNIGSVTIPPNHPMPPVASVIEVRYLYAYPGGSLYQPTYLGRRDDIDVDECRDTQLRFKPVSDDGEHEEE